MMGSMQSAQALTIVETVGEFSSPQHNPGTYYDDYFVGTFSYDLTGLTIVSASISGNWGNSLNSTTAHNELWLDGLQVADTHDYSPDPTSNSYVPWSYDFDVSEFSVLADGVAEFHTIQTSEYVVRLGETTLMIEAIPEPVTVCLLGLGGLVLRRRKR